MANKPDGKPVGKPDGKPSAERISQQRREELTRLSTPRIPPGNYIPHTPHPGPQQLFLCLDDVQEVFYGGSAGPGKSWALLAAALQYVDVPGYAALILRRTWPDLSQPGALMDRAGSWLRNTDAKPVQAGKSWVFPSGARLVFGYAQRHEDVLTQYSGPEFHYIGIDELTQGWERRSYEFLFSRLRRPRTADGLRASEWDGTTLNQVPLRFRTASNPGGCIDKGDVLTPGGWVPIQDVQVGDPIFTVEKNGGMTETKVARTFVYDWDDDLIKANARGFHLSITPDHRVAKVGGAKQVRDAAFSLVPFEELPGQATILRSVSWQGTPLAPVRPPVVPTRRRRLQQPMELPGRLHAELLGWWLSEGYTVPRDRAFGISQDKIPQRAQIEDCLTRCGFSFRAGTHQFLITAPEWQEHFDQFGHYQCDRFIPEEIKAGTPDDLRPMFQALMAGDGHWQSEDGGTYFTTSERLADDVAEVALKLGYLVYQSSYQQPDRRDRSRLVHVKRIKSGGTELLTGQHRYNVPTETKRRSQIERVPFRGKVYCLGIDDTETFIVRQNGCVWVSGNSSHTWVKEAFVDPETRSLGAVYIPAKLTDNPSLDPDEYAETLGRMASSPVMKARLLHGDWSVVDEGNAFKREWFTFVGTAGVPADCMWCRYWDLAAINPRTKSGSSSSSKAQGDWVASALVGLSPQGQWYIADIRRTRGTPLEVERFIAATLDHDQSQFDAIVPTYRPGRRLDRMEQEGGASGVNTVDNYGRNVFVGMQFEGSRPKSSKAERARPVSTAAEAGNVFLVRCFDPKDYLDEAELFPHGSNDDMCDAVSGAFHVLAERLLKGKRNAVTVTSVAHRHIRRVPAGSFRPRY